jgi:hypothetical protein
MKMLHDVILLESTKDKNLKDINIYFANKIVQSPALGLLFNTYAELLRNNLGTQGFYWEQLSSCHAVYAQDAHHKVLSGLSFVITEDKVSMLVTAFSLPEERGTGISKLCFPYYLQKSKELGAKRTMSLVSVQNKDVIKIKDNQPTSYSGPKASIMVYGKKF